MKKGTAALQTYDVGSFHGRVWDHGSGSPVLYLHGYEQHPGSAEFLTRFAEHHRVIAPEHPGYGRSTASEHIDGTLDYVLYYQELMTVLGVNHVDVVGHCLGGMIAGELAAVCPSLVRKLVLVDAYGLWLDDAPAPDPFFTTADELARAKWHDPAAAPDPEPSIFENDPQDALWPMIFRTLNLATATRFLWPLPDRGLSKRLPLVKAQTMVVHGESDGLLPLEYAEEFVRLIPDSVLVRMPEAGHLPMIERVDEFVDAVEQFLAQ